MNKRWSKKYRRFIAFFMIICMVFSNSGVMAAVTEAEEMKIPEAGQKDISKSTDVSSITKSLVDCELEFVAGSGSDTEPLSGLKVTVKDGSNTVMPEESGNYLLIPEQKYQYIISDQGMEEDSKEGTFTAPRYIDENSQKITIPVELIEPSFTIEGKDCTEITQLKKDSIISLVCTNYNELYKKEEWKYILSEDKKAGLKNAISIKCTGDSFNINYEYGKYKSTVFSSSITTFSNYKLKAFYDLTENDQIELVNPNFVISKKDAQSDEDQTIDQTDMEPGSEYEVSVSVKGFTDVKGVLITPNSYEPDITIEAGEMVVPKITTTSEKMGYCGGDILLNDVKIDETDCYPERGSYWDWDWRCVKEGDSNKKLPIIKETGDKIGKIDLRNAEDGTYKLTCGYNDIRSSNFIKVTVSRLKLDIDLGKMPVTEKIYDDTPQFKIELSIKNDPAIVLDNKNSYDISDDDKIEITCNVESADVGKYSIIKDVTVNISKNEEKYDISAIKEKLEGKAVNLGSEKLIINKAIIKVTNPKIVLQYRSNIIDLKKTNENMGEGNNGWVDTDLNTLFGKVIFNEEMKDYCDFENLNHTENEDEIVIEGKNAKYSFLGLQMNQKTKYRMLQWEYTSEIIQDKDIAGKITLKQKKYAPSTEDVIRNNKEWCNENDITAEIISSEYKDDDAYDTVTFIKMQNIKNNEDLKKQDIAQDNGKAGAPKLIISGIKERTYYKMMFTRGDPGWKYSSVAAIICLIPENPIDENEIFPEPNIINDSVGREYPVITLFVDSNPAEINFNEEDLERDQSKKEILPGNYMSKIGFEVNNIGFAWESIHYSFCKFDSKNKIIKVDDIPIPKLEDYVCIPLEENNKYTIDCPDNDGDYVLYLKLKNTDGREDVYISNGLFVDNVPPEIEAIFKTGENDIKEGKFYTNQTVKAKFVIKEPHLENVKVTITAEERDGKKIETIDVTSIKNELEQYLKGKEQTAEYEFTQSANYTVRIEAEDRVGLKKEETYQFTVDNEKPDKGVVLAAGSYHNIKTDKSKETGKIELIFEELAGKWENLKNTIFNNFSQEEIKVTLEGNDRISPFSMYYYITDAVMTEEQLDSMDDESWTEYFRDGDKNPKITVNKKDIVYGKIMDQAGNICYFCSEGMITDNKAPEVKISVNKEANKNNFYHDDIPFSAFIEDKIADGGTESAGLQYVSYRIEADDKNADSKVILDSRDHKDFTKKNCNIKEGIIKADKFNKNNVKLYVTAVDNAGNKEEVLKKFSIDTEKPEISVTYNDEQGNKYYNHKRTATITIKERNLDTKDVKISVKSVHGNKASIGKWSHSSNVGKSDDATHTCKVTFSEDDDYEFLVSCVDMAGNKAKKNFSDKFTLDTTVPVISVSYNGRNPEQNAYYNEAITATITIKEHNFNAGKVNIQTHTAGSSDSGVQGVSAFSSNGDIHTATVPYSTDGIYGLDVTYTDEAGNQAVPFNGNTFTIDITEPELIISNVEDKSANKDEVMPIVTCTDTNYDKEQVSITVRGANSGEVDLGDIGYAVSDITNGQQFVMDFPKTEERDDIYILTAKMADRAGNEKESSIEFSVNRYGSVYTLGTETGEWLTNGECAYIKEGKPVVIIETNVDEVVEQNISYTAGGVDASTISIQEAGQCSAEEKMNGTYFEASEINGENQWYQYRYEINAENFEKEGRYTIQIDSTDKAGNHTSNVSNKHINSNLQVQFAVDQTAPSAVISGATSGTVYNDEEHTVLIDVQDNLAINKVTVYLNDQEYGTYSAKEIAEMEDGFIPIVVGQSFTTQKIQVKAIDMAGNTLSRDAGGTYDKVFDDFRIIVTRNLLVRFFHTPWLLLLALFILVCITGGTVLIIMKRKKTKQET